MAAADLFIDVQLEIEDAEIARQPDPGRYVLERMREKADELCAREGARLRTDRAPEIIIKRAAHRLLGIDVVLVASRWAVVAPERVLARN